MRQLKQFLLRQVDQRAISRAEAFDLLRELTEAELAMPPAPGAAAAPPPDDTHRAPATPAAAAPAHPSVAPGPAPAGDIAVVGLACRLPGASSADELWRNLVAGVDAVGPYPRHRMFDFMRTRRALWDAYHARAEDPDDDPLLGGWLDHVDRFDADFFGISAADALTMGPAERLFLETAWEALEQAGATRRRLAGSSTGIYLAHSPEVPFEYSRTLPDDDPQAIAFNNPGATGYRLAYWLDLRGPTAVVNTTCSSSLVACHLASQSLRTGECDLALAGGISLFLFPFFHDTSDPMRLRSPDGRCKAFDARANGLSMGEGIGIVVLKRLEDAQRDRDFVIGVIKGSAVNSDGRSNGLTAPNPAAQTDVILRAWERAGIDPQTISCVEAHGAGTQLGDPIEVKGLTQAFQRFTPRKRFCALGSVKTNISHLGDAAGVAGLIKMLLGLRHHTLPASLHFRQVNPLIPLADSPFYMNTETRPWEPTGDVLRAGVSSFGISGTNCHMVLEEAPARLPRQAQVPAQAGPRLLPLSARSLGSLWQLLARYEEFLADCPEADIDALAHTAARRREHHEYRVAILGSSVGELRQKVGRLGQLRHLERLPRSFSAQGIHAARVAPGGSEQYSELPPADTSAAHAAAHAYLTQIELDWDRWLGDQPGDTIPLPGYCFNSVRIWPTHEVPEERRYDDLFFDLRWTPAPLPAADAVAEARKPRTDGAWLVLGDDDPLCAALIEGLRQAGVPAVAVAREGEQLARTDTLAYTIDPAELEDYEDLIAAVAEDTGALPLVGILHLWSCRPPDASMDSLEGITRSQDRAALSAFRLAKAMIAHRQGLEADFFVVAAHAHAVDGSEPVVIPARVTGFGFAKVLSQEIPTISICGVDLDLGQELEGAHSPADAVLAELAVPRPLRSDVVAWRRGTRYVQQLDRMEPAQLRAGDGQDAPAAPVRDGGVYVIAGGTGYLGIQMGLYLARQARVKVALLARTKLPARERWDEARRAAGPDSMLAYQLAGIEEMESLGAEVVPLPADVTDPLQLEAALDRTRKRFGPITGVIGAMKQLYHKNIDTLTEDEFRSAIMNRVRGTWLLDALTRQDDLDFLVLMSSISSIMGTRTASECAAVNQYLDCHAAYGRAQSRRVSVMNLTLVLDDRRDFRGPTPIPPLDFAEFHGCFDLFLRYRPGLAVVARFDPEEVSYLLPVLRIPFSPALLDALGVRRTAASAAPAPPPEAAPAPPAHPAHPAHPAAPQASGAANAPAELEAKLRSVWHEILGQAPSAGEDGFFALGGTSLTALKLVQAVRRTFGVAFEPTDVFATPSFAAMAGEIANRLAPARDPNARDPLASVLDDVADGELSVDAALDAIRNTGDR